TSYQQALDTDPSSQVAPDARRRLAELSVPQGPGPSLEETLDRLNGAIIAYSGWYPTAVGSVGRHEPTKVGMSDGKCGLGWIFLRSLEEAKDERWQYKSQTKTEVRLDLSRVDLVALKIKEQELERASPIFWVQVDASGSRKDISIKTWTRPLTTST